MSMLGYWMPAVRCKNLNPRPRCGPIFLPLPNAPEVSLVRPTWPKPGWQPLLICRHCGAGFEYTALDLEWQSSPNQTLPAEIFVVYAELQCGQPGCEFPVRLYLSSDSAMTEADRNAKLESGSMIARCRAGHPPVLPLNIVQCTVANEIF
jgi:hypothetical protein